MANPDVTALQQQIAAARTRFLVAKRSLDALVGPVAAEHLIGHADEFGIEDALRVVREDPDGFELTAPLSSAVFAALHVPLDVAYVANSDMDTLVFKREALLKSADPTRPQVFNVMGREVEFDPVRLTLRDLAGGSAEPVSLHRKPDSDNDHNHDDDRQM